MSSCGSGFRGRKAGVCPDADPALVEGRGVSPIEAAPRARAGPALTQARLPPEGGHLSRPGARFPEGGGLSSSRPRVPPSRDRAFLSPSRTQRRPQLCAARPAEKPPPTLPKPPTAPPKPPTAPPPHPSPHTANSPPIPPRHMPVTSPASTARSPTPPPRAPTALAHRDHLAAAPLLTCRIPLTAAGPGAPLGPRPLLAPPRATNAVTEPGRTGDGTVTAPTPEGLAASFSTHCPARRDVTAGALVTPCE